MLVSDHGMHAGALRPAAPARDTVEGYVRWHRGAGVIAVRGAGVKQDELIWGAHLLDVAPTAAAVLGLPVGEDLEGRVLTEAFVEAREAGPESRTRPANVEMLVRRPGPVLWTWRTGRWDDGAQSSALDGDVSGDRAVALARVHLDAARYEEAATLLAQARWTLGEIDACATLVDDVLWRGGEHPPLALLLKGAVHVTRGEAGEGLVRLAEAERAGPLSAALTTDVGRLYRGCGRLSDAARAFERAIDADPGYAPAHEGLAEVRLAADDVAGAADAALMAVRLRHQSPTAHALPATALERLGETERAAVHRAIAGRRTVLSLEP